jgi:hypothetical protein
MNNAEVESLRQMFKSVTGAMKDMVGEINKLKAENKELRSLWIENEGDIIKVKVRLDALANDYNEHLADLHNVDFTLAPDIDDEAIRRANAKLRSRKLAHPTNNNSDKEQ